MATTSIYTSAKIDISKKIVTFIPIKLTPWSRVLLQKPVLTQVKKCLAFMKPDQHYLETNVAIE
jgi:hypothetical protein